MTEDDYYMIRTYLKSGGGSGTVNEVEHYLFTLTNGPTMHKYNHFKAVQEAAGVIITSIDKVIDTFGQTITARRPVTKLRCDFMRQAGKNLILP